MNAPVRRASSDCPSPDALRRLLLGQFSEDLEAVEQHFQNCDDCLAFAEHGSEDDAILRAVRNRTSVPRDDAIDIRVAELVRRLAKQIPANGDGPTHPYLAPPQAPDELGRLGDYRILKKLGAGGMGIVFLAEHTKLKQLRALKVIRADLATDPKVRQRFLREAQTAAAIQHDHVVSIHDFGEDGGVLFLLMPLLKGESLHSRLDREKKLPMDDVLRIGCETAEALTAAHELTPSVIHRDIKPNNIWLEGERARVKVLDFGLARPENDALGLTEFGALIGNPQYMAPEQAAGEPVGPRADLFSLGVVLYVMSTGELPFPGKTPMAVLHTLANHAPTPPCQRNPDIPQFLSRLILRLLEKNPADRPASARVVADELRALQKNIRPTPKPRRRFAWAVAVAVLAAVLVMEPLVILYGETWLNYVKDQGELVVEADEKAIEVLVTKAGVTVQDKDGKQSFLLTPGKRNLKSGQYQINVTNASGLQLETDEFTITRAGRKIIHVTARARPDPGTPFDRPAVFGNENPGFEFVRATTRKHADDSKESIARSVVPYSSLADGKYLFMGTIGTNPAIGETKVFIQAVVTIKGQKAIGYLEIEKREWQTITFYHNNAEYPNSFYPTWQGMRQVSLLVYKFTDP